MIIGYFIDAEFLDEYIYSYGDCAEHGPSRTPFCGHCGVKLENFKKDFNVYEVKGGYVIGQELKEGSIIPRKLDVEDMIPPKVFRDKNVRILRIYSNYKVHNDITNPN